VAWRTGRRTRRARGRGRLRPARFSCRLGPPEAQRSRPELRAYVCRAAERSAVALGSQPALTLRGGPVSLGGASPRPGPRQHRGVSGGEAASFFSVWAAQRPAAVTRPPSAALPAVSPGRRFVERTRGTAVSYEESQTGTGGRTRQAWTKPTVDRQRDNPVNTRRQRPSPEPILQEVLRGEAHSSLTICPAWRCGCGCSPGLWFAGSLVVAGGLYERGRRHQHA
jgi:hypothetical protein